MVSVQRRGIRKSYDFRYSEGMSSPSNKPAATRPPLTDSPWFWVYTFATFALVALMLIGPKFQSRQSQEERKFQGRTRAQQQKLGEEPQGELSEPGRTWLTLTPIYIVLGTMIAMGWGTLWWQRWRMPR